MKSRQLLVAVLLIGVAHVAIAQSNGIGVDSVLGMIKQSMAPAINKLTAQAISWVGVFATLQFFITNYNLLKSDGDIQSAIAKLVGAVAWIGICVYIINNGPQFIQAVGDQMMGLLGVDLPSPGSIIAKTIGVTATMAVLALGVGSIPFVGDTAGQLMIYIALGVLGVGLLFAFKIFMLQLELGLIAMLSPLSFSFLGLNTLKDQGIAPFKALLSLGYRVILLTVILSGFSQISDMVSDTLAGITVDTFKGSGIGDVVNVMLSAICSYALLGYLTWKSDAIAATMASGSTSLGTGDVAQAAAAGAAMGAAVATGGATAATAAGKVPESMASFMGNLMGSGSVSNASPMGSGGNAPVFTPPGPPSLSVGNSGASGGQAAKPASSPVPPASSSAPPSRTSPPKEPITSGRFGGESPQLASGQQNAEGEPISSQGGAEGGKSESGATATEPAAATPADAQGNTAGTSSNVAGSRAEVPEAANAAAGSAPKAVEGGKSESGATATEPVTITPANAQGAGASGKVAGSTAEVPEGANAAPGSALSAGIGGKPSLEENLHKLVEHLANQQQGPRKPTLGERLGEANRHVSQESAATHVSINTHHSD